MGWRSWMVSTTEIFERRAHVMRVVPHVMRAASVLPSERHVRRFSAGSAWATSPARNEVGSSFSFSPEEEGSFPGKIWSRGWHCFTEGIGTSWFRTASAWQSKFPRIWCEEAATTIRTLEARAVRAEKFVQLGEISAGRQALESAHVAPGTLATLRALTKRQRRPPVPREPVPEGLATAMPESPFNLDFDRFTSNIRRAKRGAAPFRRDNHPSSRMTPVWSRCSVLRFVPQGPVPLDALEGLKLGRITALAKPDGGVRGIVVGDVFRRIVAIVLQQIEGHRATHSAHWRRWTKPRRSCQLTGGKLST